MKIQDTEILLHNVHLLFTWGKIPGKDRLRKNWFLVYIQRINSSKSPVMIYVLSTVGSLLASISSLTKSPLKCFLICWYSFTTTRKRKRRALPTCNWVVKTSVCLWKWPKINKSYSILSKETNHSNQSGHLPDYKHLNSFFFSFLTVSKKDFVLFHSLCDRILCNTRINNNLFLIMFNEARILPIGLRSLLRKGII